MEVVCFETWSILLYEPTDEHLTIQKATYFTLEYEEPSYEIEYEEPYSIFQKMKK